MRCFRSGEQLAILASACAFGLLAVPSTAPAAVGMTFGAAAPTLNGADQANFVDDATIPGGTFNQQAFSDNAGPPGQTFTTPTSSLGLTLNSISLKGANTGGANSGGNVFAAGTTWGLRVSSVSGTTLTPVQTYTNIPTVTGATGNEWFTFNFTGADALALAGDTQYAFEVFSSAGYLGFDAAVDPASYASGFAFNSTGAARQFSSTTLQDRGYDRTFHVDLTAVPEPASASLACAGAAAILFRRRRV
jgi:hypothetical protein